MLKIDFYKVSIKLPKGQKTYYWTAKDDERKMQFTGHIDEEGMVSITDNINLCKINTKLDVLEELINQIKQYKNIKI